MKTGYVQRYQRDFESFYPNGRAFAFYKGRVALYAILRALDIQPGDEVIMPGFTCLVDATPVKYLGAKPVYVDIDEDIYNMDLGKLEEKITDRTKVVIAQHTYGYPLEMDLLLEIAGKHNFKIVEDCCHTFGSKYKNRLAGAFGDAAYFSSQWNKLYTTGIGGVAVLYNESDIRKLEQICNVELGKAGFKDVSLLFLELLAHKMILYPQSSALLQKLFRWLSGKGLIVGSSSKKELASEAGCNVNMPEEFFTAMSALQARTGISRLKMIDKNICHRKKIVKIYDDILAERGWRVTKYSDYIEPVLVRYPVLVDNKKKTLELAESRFVELGDWFVSPLHDEVKNFEIYDYIPGMCPIAEKICKHVVNLPVHQRVSEKQAIRTAKFICQFEQFR
ncbi:MAG: DegT/DnrJ/EryC1/StrS family aminotransferase [Planctomycetota bacterium]